MVGGKLVVTPALRYDVPVAVDFGLSRFGCVSVDVWDGRMGLLCGVDALYVVLDAKKRRLQLLVEPSFVHIDEIYIVCDGVHMIL